MILPSETAEREITRTLKSLGFEGKGQHWKHGVVQILHGPPETGKAIVAILLKHDTDTWGHEVAEMFRRVEVASKSYEHAEVTVCVFVERSLPHACVVGIEDHDFDFPVEVFRVGEDPAPLVEAVEVTTPTEIEPEVEDEDASSAAAIKPVPLAESQQALADEDEFLGKSGHEILDLLQTHLVDLTRRSSLLHFSTGKDNVRVVQERANDLYESLVVKGEAMKLEPYWPDELESVPTDEGRDPAKLELFAEETVSGEPAEQRVAKVDETLPSHADDDRAEYTDDLIQTSHPHEELVKRTQKLWYAAGHAMRQSGVNQLYLAIGFLQWYESPDSEQVTTSPLVLLPLEMKRINKSVVEPVLPGDNDYDETSPRHQTRRVQRYVYELSYSGDEIRENVGLALRMEAFDQPLPEIAAYLTTGDLEGYVKEVHRWAAGYALDKRWKAELKAVVGVFDFARVWMYDDLSDAVWRETDSNVVESFFGGDSDPRLPVISDDKLERSEADLEVPLVCPADSSQYEVILHALGTKSLVIEGPPGTGKSQTIANILAGCLAKGERVLFLAAKETALSVVASRLEQAGLGPFLLPMHADGKSSGTSPKEVSSHLAGRLVLDDKPKPHTPYEAKAILKRAQQSRERLNRIARVLGSRVEASGESLSRTMGQANAAWGEYTRASEGLGLEPLELSVEAKLEEIGRDELNTQVLDFFNQLDIMHENGELTASSTWQGLVVPGADEQTNQDLIERAKRLLEAWDAFADVPPPDGIQSETEATVGGLLALAAVSDRVPSVDWDLDTLGTEAEIIAEPIETQQHLKDLAKLIGRASELERMLDIEADYLPGKQVLDELVRKRGEIVSRHAQWRNASDQLTLHNLRELLIAIREVVNAVDASEAIMDECPKLEARSRSVGLVRQWVEVLRALKQSQTIDWDDLVPGMASPNSKTLLGQLKKAAIGLQQTEAALKAELDFACLPEAEDRRRLRGQLRNTGMVSKLFGPQKKAVNECRQFLVNPKVKAPRILELLTGYEELLEEEAKFAEFADGERLFGPRYKGRRTDWSLVEEGIGLVESLVNIGGIDRLSRVLAMERSEVDSSLLADWLDSIHRLQELAGVHQPLGHYGLVPIGSLRWSRLAPAIDEAIADLAQIIEWYDQVEWKPWREVPFGQIGETLESASELDDVARAFGRHPGGDRLGSLYFERRTSGEVIEAVLGACRALEEIADDESDAAGQVRDYFRRTPWSVAFTKVGRWSDAAATLAKEVRAIAGEFDAIGTIKPGDPFDVAHCGDSPKDWRRALEARVSDPSGLSQWRSLSQRIVKAEELGLKPLTDLLLSGACGIDYLRVAFEAVLQRQVVLLHLRNQGVKIESLLDQTASRDRREFQEADHRLHEFAPAEVFCQALDLERGDDGPSGVRIKDKRGMQLINHVTGKNNRVSLRELLGRAGDTMKSLQPCWLMSPGSVSQYLPRVKDQFDVLIVDEASQLRTAEVAPAALRCKRVLIFGDTKQMPPSNQMSRRVDDDNEDYEVGESVLDRAARSLPTARLKWHYRSHHEDLIRYSNYHFYGNELVIFPTCLKDDPDHGVYFEQVEGYFVGRRNKEEAQRIVQLMSDHIRREADKDRDRYSLGVVAMNADHRDLIADLFEKEKAEDASLARAVRKVEEAGEPVFVTNLESVQGDERDHIVISCTYGPEAPDLPTRNNFGPINNSGGERRLNVLFTRARRKMTVVASFDPSAITAQSVGAKHFRGFLEYAKTKIVQDQGEVVRNEPESHFEELVGRALKDAGYDFDYQVGVAAYRIDLAVKHPENPSRYILAVECDGAAFHSSRTARERDRVRQEILEHKGWVFHRIWSTDWFHDEHRAKQRLLDAIRTRIDTLRAASDVPRDALKPEKSWDVFNGREADPDPPDKEPVSGQLALETEPAAEQTPDPVQKLSVQAVVEDPPMATSRIGTQTESQVAEESAVVADADDEALAPYPVFDGHLPDPRTAKPIFVAIGLQEIVEAEGPMLMSRVIEAYRDACGLGRAGKDVRSAINKAMVMAIERGSLERYDELGDGHGFKHTSFVSPKNSMRFPRERGPRDIASIPLRELRAMLNHVAKAEGWEFGSAEHFQAVRNKYNLARLREPSVERLKQAICVEPY